MQHKMLKLSTLAMLIAGATGANAAVYKVVEVTDASDIESLQYFSTVNTSNNSVEFYGQGIEDSSTTPQNCFTTDCGDASEYKVVGESRRGTDGINYRDTIAFLTDNDQHVNNRADLEQYCNNYLGFNTCDVWARSQYYGNNYNRDNNQDLSGFGGLQKEQSAWSLNYYSNASSIVQVDGANNFARVGTFASNENGYSTDKKNALGSIVDTSNHLTTNSIANGVGQLVDGKEFVYGITSSAFFNNGAQYARAFTKRGFVNVDATNVELTPPVVSRQDDKLAEEAGQTLANDAVVYDGGLLVVGSAAYAPSFYYNRNLSGGTSWYYDDEKKPNTDDINVSGLGFSDDNFKNCVTDPTAANVYSKYECQFSTFANQATVWSVDSTGTATASAIVVPNLPVLDVDGENRSYQASAQAVSLVSGQPVAVGFATDSVNNDYYASRAAIFESSGSGINLTWTQKFISGLDIKPGSDRIYSYTAATGINDNNKVIGIAKNNQAENRSYAQKMFVFDNVAGTTKFLDTKIDPTIFFDGSNGYTAAINNNDVVVGWVDSETVNQIDGRERRQRAFLFNDGATIANSPLSANGAWMLDNLTNDNGDKSAVANQFRIAQATGINDAGVISASALRCAGGYDNLTSESQCSGGERLVAVKLVPIPGGTVDVRPEDSGTITRSGASFGMFALTLLGLFGFRRRK